MGIKSRIKKERKIAWEKELIKNQSIKSNTLIVFIPILVLFASLVLLEIYEGLSKNQFQALFCLMFGYLFIGTSIAQIRSGYLWKNLVPGNRGKQKSEAPVIFIVSNIIYAITGLGFWGYSIICLF